MNIKLAPFLIFFALISSKGLTQTLENLNDSENKYQSCLDEGKYMLGCTQVYYDELNELLIKTHQTLLEKVEEANPVALETDHQEWLERRDLYFRKVETEHPDQDYIDSSSNDGRMILLDHKANFVKERIKNLIIRIGSR